MKLRPSSLDPTFSASPLRSRLRASNWVFMASNLTRLSLVARSALPCGRRKLRAKPSFTRTTSPIWPSLATRSSRMTSIFASPLRYRFELSHLLRVMAWLVPAIHVLLAEFGKKGVDARDKRHDAGGVIRSHRNALQVSLSSRAACCRRPAPGRAAAQAEQRLGDADQRHDQDRPDQQNDEPVGARQHDGAAAHMARCCV